MKQSWAKRRQYEKLLSSRIKPGLASRMAGPKPVPYKDSNLQHGVKRLMHETNRLFDVPPNASLRTRIYGAFLKSKSFRRGEVAQRVRKLRGKLGTKGARETLKHIGKMYR